MTLAPGDPRHGTMNGYVNGRCRCKSCRAARAAYQRDWRARRAAGFYLPLEDPRHGTINGADHFGCRCEPCREARRKAERERRLRRGLVVRLYRRGPVGPERERDTRGWNGRLAREYGCTVTFENEDGATLTLHRRGAPEAVLAALCDEAKAIDETLRVVSYSSPATILTDVTGPPTRLGRYREATILGMVGRLEMLHPRLRGRSRKSEPKYRELDALGHAS